MKKPVKMVWNVLFWLLAVALGLSAGYGLSLLLFAATGTPPPFVAYLVAGVLGIAVTAAAFLLFAGLYRHFQLKSGKPNKHRQPFADFTEALGRIARGDFEVLLPVGKGPSHYEDIAKSVNAMAKELGNMEHLRQNFISDVSHELQTPLTSIGGFAALLKKDGVTPAQAQGYAEIIEAEAARLSALSDNLLRLSALEHSGAETEKTPFRLDKQLQNVVLTLEPQWQRKNITVEASLARAELCGNEDLLSQVWINLIHNAVKYAPENGKIEVALADTESGVAVTIGDNGIGIPKEHQARIFERFYKVDKTRDSSRGGNGLGLSIVKKIVDLHGGAIRVESAEGQGAVFTVTLPK